MSDPEIAKLLPDIARRVAASLLAEPSGSQPTRGIHVTVEGSRPETDRSCGCGPDSEAASAGGTVEVAIGADHGGFALKRLLADHLRGRGLTVHDLGTHSDAAVDYPDFAAAVAQEVAAGRARVGIVVDGAGIGSAMAANKLNGVRAAACYSTALARNAREHNHANVLTLGSGQLDPPLAREIVDTFLSTDFGPDRHARRVAKIDALGLRPSRQPQR